MKESNKQITALIVALVVSGIAAIAKKGYDSEKRKKTCSKEPESEVVEEDEDEEDLEDLQEEPVEKGSPGNRRVVDFD